MIIKADNGVILGELEWEDDTFWFTTKKKMTEYMLEQTLIHMRKRMR